MEIMANTETVMDKYFEQRRELDDYLTARHITQVGADCLVYLAEKEATSITRAVSMAEVFRALRPTPVTTLSRTMAEQYRDGLVHKRPSLTDQRSYLVNLTDKGITQCNAIKRFFEEAHSEAGERK
jgi:DNA-binding MarR family transcriptional regulator